jgi:polyhydroxyalkanoate synthesis regulator phasin
MSSATIVDDAMRQNAFRGKESTMTQLGNGRRSILKAVRRLMQFSVGSALILQEKAEEFVSQAIERGQEAQDEGKKLVQEMRAERKSKKPKRNNALDVRIDKALTRLNVPSQKDINGLNKNIAELAERIDELNSDG